MQALELGVGQQDHNYPDADSAGAPATCDNSSKWPDSSAKSKDSYDSNSRGLLGKSSDKEKLYNQTQSLLFTIPPEIRLKIYEYVVGKDNFMHVESGHVASLLDFDAKAPMYSCSLPIILEKCHHDGRMETELYHKLANAKDPVGVEGDDDSDEELGDLLDDGSGEHIKLQLDYGTLFTSRHLECLLWEEPKHGGVNINFLTTCKKLYDEAKYFHLYNMTFSFRYPYLFDDFVTTLTKKQLSNVRSLHFDISSVCEMSEWAHSIEGNKVALFTSLKSLYIWLDLPLQKDIKKRAKGYMQTLSSDVFYKKPFCLFRMCPLKEVKIILNPGCCPGKKLPGNHVSWDEMGLWCREFEKRLLLPWNGPIDLLDI
ncbi:hypothetical protein TWF506_008069 [Arthrobotrys conoides]|uniref:Uncharacterized protein n=1 Tax=Arthrobotrys conoides TaxID=74498 RepID=A0AAN8NDW0_9PEZI